MLSKVEEIENCNCKVIHQDVVDTVKKEMLQDEITSDLAELFKILGDKTRINILQALSKAEMCVCDISALLNMNRTSVSHQLNKLRQAKLVKYRKSGKIVYYSLDDEHVKQIFKQGLIHLTEKINY